ncbi:MAG: M15 family metallopeptidase [Verrucomicrobiaceae bacterium]|nr:M15 family metallopeptidase [Verrucomicrobiaceae bacterium]
MPAFSRSAVLILAVLASCTLPAQRRGALVSSTPADLARKYDLVDLRQVAPDVRIDLRYASKDNVARRRLYPARMPCLLRRATAEKLKRAQAALAAQGYGIRVWDAYRPPEVQVILHHHARDTGLFLSPENGWSRHCGGVCVDATMVDRHGNEVRMPTWFDENLERASSRGVDADPEVRRNLAIFHLAMRKAGFVPLPSEWWHFDDADFLYHPQPVIFSRQLGIQVL